MNQRIKQIRSTVRFFVILIQIHLGFAINGICTTSADVVWVKSQPTPLFGQVITNTPEQVQIRLIENGQPGKTKSIERSMVEQIVINIDAKRLAGLSPDNPQDYRDYAEELASQTIDPAARELARRLFLISAKIAEDKSETDVCASALSGLISLTDAESERRQLEMLQFLVNPEANEPESNSESGRADHSPSKLENEMMLRLVRAIRREDSDQAIRLLGSQSNRVAIRKWSEICTPEEFDQIAKVNRPSKSQLGKMLQIEWQILTAMRQSPDMKSGKIKTRRVETWGDFASQDSGNPRLVPSFENVTAMDPRKSIFRNGRWMRPE